MLKELIKLQSRLNFYFSALPVWLQDGHEVMVDELDDERTYTMVGSELVCEGGLDWTVLRGMETKSQPLGVTCADLVWNYLEKVSPTLIAT